MIVIYWRNTDMIIFFTLFYTLEMKLLMLTGINNYLLIYLIEIIEQLQITDLGLI